MRRRTLLAATAGLAALAGCQSPLGGGSATAPETPSPARQSADGGTSFEILDVSPPTRTSRPVTVTFDDRRVVVMGTIVPAGCREPVLQSTSDVGSAGTLRVVVGTESTLGPSPTAVCETGVYRYRCIVPTGDRTPTTVEVVHDYAERADRTFVRERV